MEKISKKLRTSNSDDGYINKSIFEEIDKCIQICSCPWCISLKTKILHDNFRLGVVVGFGR